MHQHYSHEFEHVFCSTDITEWMREIFRERLGSDLHPGIVIEGTVRGWTSTPHNDEECPDWGAEFVGVSIFIDTADDLEMELPIGEDFTAILGHFAPSIIQDAFDKELN